MRLNPGEATSVHVAVTKLGNTPSVKQAIELFDQAFLLQQ